MINLNSKIWDRMTAREYRELALSISSAKQAGTSLEAWLLTNPRPPIPDFEQVWCDTFPWRPNYLPTKL